MVVNNSFIGHIPYYVNVKARLF